MFSMRTPFIREINALKIDVKRFIKSCILKCSSNFIFIVVCLVVNLSQTHPLNLEAGI